MKDSGTYTHLVKNLIYVTIYTLLKYFKGFTMKFTSIFILFVCLILSSCISEEGDTEGIGAIPVGGGIPYPADPVVTRHDPTVATSFDATPIFRVTNLAINSGSSLKLYSDETCSTLALTTDTTWASSVDIDLTISGIGTLVLSVRNFDGLYGTSSNCISFSYTVQAPLELSNFSLVSPASSPGYDPTPTIKINSGLITGHTAKLYSDSACSTEIGSKTINGSTIDITTSALGTGTTNIYAKQINEGGVGGICSTNTIAYEFQYLSRPNTLAVAAPSIATSIFNQPKISVSGLEDSTSEIRLYSDSSCSTQIGFLNGSIDTTEEFYISNALSVGVHNIYAKRFGSNESLSQCSTDTATVTVQADNRLNFSAMNSISTGRTDHLAIGDVNGDGNKDILTQYSFSGYLKLGNGNGTFQDTITIYSMFSSTGGGPLLLADLDGDGDDEIISGDNLPGIIYVYISNGDGTFATKVSYSVGSGFTYYVNDIKAIDINKDGKMDIVTSNGANSFGSVSVFLGNGDGTVQTATHYSVGTKTDYLAIADIDKDTWPDVVVSQHFDKKVGVFINNGDGTLAAMVNYDVSTDGPAELEVVDFNNDTNLDIIVASRTDGIALLAGNGNGTFNASTLITSAASSVENIAIGDLDGDSNIDLMYVHSLDRGDFYVQFGNGDGTFTAHMLYMGPSAGMNELGLADFDGDGDLDAVIATYDSSYGLGVLINQ